MHNEPSRPPKPTRVVGLALCAAIVTLTGCGSAEPVETVRPSNPPGIPLDDTTASPDPAEAPSPEPSPELAMQPQGPITPPDETPDFENRRMATVDVLPPPATDSFVSSIRPVPDEVIERSTWTPECPVERDDLSYITVSFWGFDGEHHTGEILAHDDAAEGLVEVFERLHAVRFPIEKMVVASVEELNAPNTGDANNSTAFVCRPTRGSGEWSQHALGRAIDINPFHNPYIRGDAIAPGKATSYLDRDQVRAGMILPDSEVVRAFDDIGWGWGGRWNDLKDWMHFSATGT